VLATGLPCNPVTLSALAEPAMSPFTCTAPCVVAVAAGNCPEVAVPERFEKPGWAQVGAVPLFVPVTN